MIIKWIIKTVTALNSNNRPGEVAAALTFGVLLAMLPSSNLIWVGILALTFFLKINFGAEMVMAAVLKPFAPLFDPFFDFFGYKILTIDALQPLYTKLSNMPVVPFSGFNNTAVVGTLALMTVLAVPIFFLFVFLLKLYREKVRDRFLSSKIIRKVSSLPIVSKVVWIFKKAFELKK
jgi:uncharacterized protein (TIGR03546 family)